VTEDEVLGFFWAKVGFQHVQNVRAVFVDRYSVVFVNKILSTVHNVLHAAFRLGQISAENTGGVGRGVGEGVHRARGGPEVGRSASSGLRPGHGPGCKDAALLAVLYAAGLRRSGGGLDLADYDQESGSSR
jgi:hypothetical protein